MSTLSVLPLQFTVNQVDFTKNIDTQLHLKKRRENLVFKTNSHQDNINIAYMIAEATNPADNLFISDRSTSLVQNRIPTSTEYVTKTTSAITLQVTDFLLTDTYTEETATVPKTPLFYIHKLANYNSGNADWDNKTLLSLSFADFLLQKKNVSEYYLDEDTGEVYNNLENTYDQATDSFECFFVKYTVRTTDDDSNTSVDIYHELINNTPVYHEASFDDLDALGALKLTAKAYLIEALPGGDYFEVTLPAYKQYSYKEKLSSRINILPPAALSLDDPWYVRVQNGKFLTSLTTSDAGATNHLYYIPEYNTQAFAPFPPYKFYPIQRAVRLSKNLIKVAENIAYDMGLQMFIDVFVKDIGGTYKAAYTNNPLIIGEFFYENILYEDAVLSFDELGGFIELSEDVEETDLVEVSYFSEEYEYEFTDIDLNPTNNLDILRERTVLYSTPETPLTGELSRALHYLRVDAEGKVIFASQPTTGLTDFGTTKMLEDFDTSGRPIDDIYYDIPSTASGLISLPSGETSVYQDELSWIDKYSVESVLLTSGVPLDSRQYYNFENNPRFLVLGDVYVGETSVPESVSKFDVRIRGGGIKDTYRDTVKDIQPELMFFWDENSRFPYPGMGSYLVEVPREVLSDYGGRFTMNEVRQVVERHAEFGTYAILREYGIDPTISGILPASGEFTIGWPSYGSDVSYTIHYSREEDKGFVQFGEEVDDAGEGNNYVTVTGLTPGSTYYTHVKGTGSDGIEHQGPTTYTQVLTHD